MVSERQADTAQRLYNSRASAYDESWHPSFARRFVSYLDIKPGQHVLDLASGTGLLSFLEADAVGSTGRVVGIDVSSSMLAEAEKKKKKTSDRYRHVEFYRGDILDLASIDALHGTQFDLITVASALVLFPYPKAAIKYWTTYLKPNGSIALDATHPQNLASGTVLERTGLRIGIPVPYYREWSKSEDSLRGVLEGAGLDVEKVVSIENQAGYGRRQYDVSQGEEVFEKKIRHNETAKAFASDELMEKAKAFFVEEWENLAVNGKIEEIDTVFLGIARKPTDGQILFEGGCRCGGVKYQGFSKPSGIILCHCAACRKLSGSAFLPFIEVPKKSVKFISDSTHRTLKLSDAAERTFCYKCGTPITMSYIFDPSNLSLTMGGVDDNSWKTEVPKITKHIFVKEKAPWVVLPDDGVPRIDTMRNADKIEPYTSPQT